MLSRRKSFSPSRRQRPSAVNGNLPPSPSFGQYKASQLDTFNPDDLADLFNSTHINDENDPNVETEFVDYDQERKQLNHYFGIDVEHKLADAPKYKKPAGFKSSTKLLKYQQDGVRWLVRQELSPQDNPFCAERQLQNGTTIWMDRFTTRTKLDGPYAKAKGSVLADEMGLGKTLQALGLILSNPPPAVADGSPAAPNCTLIVCPKSVISTWQMEIEKFVKPDALRVVQFDGTPNQRSKIMQRVHLGQVDVLLTTYGRIRSDYDTPQKTNGYGHALLDLRHGQFYRVILDEAQEIRNTKSMAYKGVMQIAHNAQYRLAMTGTPFTNNPNDVYSLLSFVGLEPWSDAWCFKHYVTNRIRDRKKAGLTHLRAALTHVALRRTKGIAGGLHFPHKNVMLRKVDFVHSDHKKVHDYWFDQAKLAYQAVESSVDVANAKFTAQLKLRKACVSGALALPEGATIAVESPSPKIYAMLGDISKMESEEKGIILSQWPSFLDIIAPELDKEGLKYVRIDGSQSQEARTSAMQALEKDDSVRFILCSLKAGGCGINLTRANKVFMMDPWWNDATEMQAVDRCHRVGQTRTVTVYRYVMKDTIEERMITNIQAAKATLGKGAMARLTAQELKQAKIVTLKDLFGTSIVHDEHDELDNEDDENWE